jgi:hypothetical protein
MFFVLYATKSEMAGPAPRMTHNAPVPSRDAEADAAYIAGMARELAVIARRHGFNTLGYLLDIAKLEAETVRKKNEAAL